jgi:hypothetical protein
MQKTEQPASSGKYRDMFLGRKKLRAGRTFTCTTAASNSAHGSEAMEGMIPDKRPVS